jgi:predicted nucleotidyltransferase
MSEAKTLSQRENEILEMVVGVLKKYLNPDKIILFGSRGKGKIYKNSDFDLAVDKGRPDIRIERKISEEIDEVAGLYEVDIVYLNNVDEAFRDIVLKTGKIIYERRS